MKNLITYIPVVAIIIAMVFAAIWAISPKAAKKIATKTAMFIIAVIAVAMILSLHGAARAEWIEAVVVDSQPTVYKGEECFLVSVDINGETKKFFDSENLAKETIVTIDYVNGKILNRKEEPKPIWFPPVVLLGAVAPAEKKFKRAQKMPPEFYLPCSLFDRNTYVVYFKDGKKCFVKAMLPEALEYITRAESKNIAAFVCAYVAQYKQQAVVACNYCEFLGYWRGTAISDRINDAYKALTIDIITNNIEPKLEEVAVISKSEIKDKDNPFTQVVEVKYSERDEDTFTFRCRKAHTPGDFVCVFTKRTDETRKTYKNVKVVKYTVMKESKVKALAKSLGYSDISEVYCDNAVDIPEAWNNWRDPADDPELYAPSAEEIADFEAMRETMLGSGYRDF